MQTNRLTMGVALMTLAVRMVWAQGGAETATASPPGPDAATVTEAAKPPAEKPKPAKAEKPAKVAKAAEPAVRVWTSLNGHTVTAEFVEVKDGAVVLKDANGAIRNVRLGLLVPADQALAQEMDAKRVAGPAAEEVGASSRLLPVFREGAAKGLHAVYSNANFVATVAASGQLSITCLDGGAAVGKPITFAAGYGYADKANHSKYVGRRIVSYEKAPRPTLAPSVLAYEATLDDGVKVGLSYEFKKNTVQVWGWVEDPAGITYPTGCHLRFAFRASHDFENDVPVVERKKVLAPYTLVVDPIEGKPLSYPYGDKVTRLATAAQRVEIEGPLFGKRRVSIVALSLKSAPLAPWIYTDFAPYQGYSVGLGKQSKSSRDERERMVLTVD